jgi:hypothetical protein
MGVLVALVGIGLAGYGIICLVKPDWTWSLQELNNSFRGVASERTGLWEMGNTIGGLIAIVAGLVLVVLSFNVS